MLDTYTRALTQNEILFYLNTSVHHEASIAIEKLK